jgi:hypothetical protein
MLGRAGNYLGQHNDPQTWHGTCDGVLPEGRGSPLQSTFTPLVTQHRGMAMIRNEKVGSKELLTDAMFHSAALGINEETKDLKPVVEEVMTALDAAVAEELSREREMTDKAALLKQAEYHLDSQVRRQGNRILILSPRVPRNPGIRAR